MKTTLTLGPIPFYWPRTHVFEFYNRVAHSDVDRVILGETVCSKRRELSFNDYVDLAKMLADHGKSVVISSLALIESQSEQKALRSACDQSPFTIEANDVATVDILQSLGKPFLGGPYLNIYSTQALAHFYADGMQSWTMPIELGKKDVAAFVQAIEKNQWQLTTEVMVHGHLPLALSARCFTARALDLPKDHCQRKCLDYPFGIPVDSQEGQRLFTINGIQTLSGDVLDLRQEVHELPDLGVQSVRIVPSQFDMTDTLQAFRQALSGDLVEPMQEGTFCNGYWHGEAGMIAHRAEPRRSVIVAD